jgi:hypothetical protein
VERSKEKLRKGTITGCGAVPRVSRTSADPHLLLTDLLPALATLHPHAAVEAVK